MRGRPSADEKKKKRDGEVKGREGKGRIGRESAGGRPENKRLADKTDSLTPTCSIRIQQGRQQGSNTITSFDNVQANVQSTTWCSRRAK